jgi:hypothetical protein
MLSCNIAFVVGYEKGMRKPIKQKIKEIRLPKIKWGIFFLACIGFLSVLMWGWEIYQQTEDNVIQVFLKSIARITFSLSLACILYEYKKKIIYATLIISSITLLNFALLKGSRSETLFIMFNIALFFYMYVKKNKNSIKILLICFLIFGSITNASIHLIRVTYFNSTHRDLNTLRSISYIDIYTQSYNRENLTNGMDLGNAAWGINFCYKHDNYDYGLKLWNGFIDNYIPRRIVGEKMKNSLYYPMKYAEYQHKLTNGITTMTGYFDAFSIWSIFGFFVFMIIGYVYGIIWKYAQYSLCYLFLKFLLISILISALTHKLQYLFSTVELLIILTIIFSPFKIFSYKIIQK